MDPLPRGKSVIVWRKNYINPDGQKGMRTICQVLRDLYFAAEARNDVVGMSQIEEAHDMAKRMQNRLKFYAGKQFKTHPNIYLAIDALGDFLWMTKAEFKTEQMRLHKAELKRARTARI